MTTRFMGICLFLPVISGLFCTSKKNGPFNDLVSVKEIEQVICVQPFKDADPAAISKLAQSIRTVYPRLVVNKPLDLPASAYYEPRRRYKADSLLKFLSSLAKPGEVMIGVTTKDISTRKDELPDWGVMGLGECPGNACVVSTFRLAKSRSGEQLFKVAIHELGHTRGLPHCPDPACYMRDAGGGNPTAQEKGFCLNCRTFFRKKNWRI